MLLFDACAIAVGFRRLGVGFADKIVGQCVLDLTKYELGNTVWKELEVTKTITEKQAESGVENIKIVLGNMRQYNVSEDNVPNILSTAVKHHLTFYDGSYLFVAWSEGFTLVSEDRKLRKAAGNAGVRALTIEGVEKEDRL